MEAPICSLAYDNILVFLVVSLHGSFSVYCERFNKFCERFNDDIISLDSISSVHTVFMEHIWNKVMCVDVKVVQLRST